MKRTSGILVLFLLALSVSAQKSIDKLFDQYSDNEGFVSVTFKGNILNMFSDESDKNDNHWPKKVTEIRILAQDDDHMNAVNFYDLAKKELDTRNYEEYMSVKKSDQDVKMYVKADGKVISEFLLIGGGEDNFIIQIKGNITYEEAEEMSSDIRNGHNHKMFSGLY
jgi:hypothetical protein